MITLDGSKLRSLETTLHPIHRLPVDIFILIPRFFTAEWKIFPMHTPLITMTHVCRAWRTLLLSTPSLWTQIDFFSFSKSQQETFLHRSGKQLLNIFHSIEWDNVEDNAEPFLSTSLCNLFRLQGLRIFSTCHYLDHLLIDFSESAAPELKTLEIKNYIIGTEVDIDLPDIFGGQMPKLTSLELQNMRTNLRAFSCPCLTRFTLIMESEITVEDFTSFFERCPLLEFVHIRLTFMHLPPTSSPPYKRICLAALKELRMDHLACITGLLDHLILPECILMMLEGEFAGPTLDSGIPAYPAPHLHPSSIDHLSVTREITKAVAMANSCVLSGPNGTLRFWCFEARANFNADFFTSFSPISVLQIRELWVGKSGNYLDIPNEPWKQTTDGVCGAFKVLTEVEDLTILSCETRPIFMTPGTTVEGGILLPRLRTLTVHVGYGDLDVSSLIRCAKARKEHSVLLEEVTVVWEKELGADFLQMESLQAFVGDLVQCVGEVPKLSWRGDDAMPYSMY